MTEEDRVRLRHTDRWVGALVLVTVAAFLAVAFQRSVIREWFAAGAQLTVLMPEEGGVAGLSAGSEAEVLGIRAGSVRQIIVAPEGRIRAELRIDEQSRVFIRSDSIATVRRRFGVAGPAYLDISRGEGAPLNWGQNPVIEARVEQAATETAGALLEELRQRIYPILDDLQRGTHAFAESMERLNKGEGTVGRLLTDDSIVRGAEEAVGRANTALATIDSVVREVQQLTSELSGTALAAEGGGNASGANARPAGTPPPGSLPSILVRADRTLALLERASRDIARATPALPRAARNVEQGTEPLPGVVVQAQETARELELLANRLRGNWLLGGGGGGGPAPRDGMRPSADRVRP
jgi:phospholipid/cholesterol/gamma-HCH transport system substrate-binding protein